MTFHCPRCDEKTKVLCTRAELRQRKCLSCGHRFHTEEIDYTPPTGFNLSGAKRDDHRRKEGANAANQST